MIYRVVAPKFVAGVITDRDERIVITAPILRSWRGFFLEQLYAHCVCSRWSIECVP